MTRFHEQNQEDMGEEEIEDILDEEEQDRRGEVHDKPEEINPADEDEDDEDVEDEEAQEGLDLDMPEEDDGMGIYHDDDDDSGFRDSGRSGMLEKNKATKSNGDVRYQGGTYRVSTKYTKDEVKDDNHKGKNNVNPSNAPIRPSDIDRDEEVYQAQESERDTKYTEHSNQDGGNHPSEEVELTQEHKYHSKIEENKEDLLARPPHGTEVFVGGISKEVTEAELRELCASCGELFEVRLMKDNEKGDNKGFAFITYKNKEEAEKSINTLNGHELKGRKLRFVPSQAKNKLFIGNVPKNWSKDEFQKVLLERGPGITNLELLMDPQNSERNRGFSFVEYYNHACAENARRNLTVAGFKFGTNIPTVNWAEERGGGPESSVSTSHVKVLYVRNLPESATQEDLVKLFEPHGEVSKVILPQSRPGQPKRDFGFIHYVDRSSALKAIDKGQKYTLGDRELEVCLAKPQSEKRPSPMYAPVGSGILPQFYQSRIGADMYGINGQSFGLQKAYGQPVIYGRGPAPAGMAMVPMVLPDGRMGYVLQQSGIQAIPAPYGDHRSLGRGSQSQRHGRGGGSSAGGSSRRYQPY